MTTVDYRVNRQRIDRGMARCHPAEPSHECSDCLRYRSLTVRRSMRQVVIDASALVRKPGPCPMKEQAA